MIDQKIDLKTGGNRFEDEGGGGISAYSTVICSLAILYISVTRKHLFEIFY